MNVFLQLGIGLIILNVIVWLVIILRKIKLLRAYIYGGTMVVFCSAFLICGILDPFSLNKVNNMEKNDLVSFAYALAEEGLYEEAYAVIDEYSSTYGYDDICSLFTARLYALEGNYEFADGIYSRLLQNSEYSKQISSEAELVHAKAGADISLLGTIKYLNENGYDLAEFGYSIEQIALIEEAVQLDAEDIKESIFNVVEKEYKTKEYKDAVKCVYDIKNAYNQYAQNGISYLSETEINTLEDYLDDLEDCVQDNSNLSSMEVIRNSALKMNLLLEDYDKIAQNIDKNASCEELMIVAELYMNDAVKDKDFSEEYLNAYEYKSEIVLERIEEIYHEQKLDMDDATAETLKNELDVWDNNLEFPALSLVKSSLQQKIDENKAGDNKSKVSLDIAQIENYCENEVATAQNINEALKTSHLCSDVEYREAMRKINSIIQSDDVSGEVLNISNYVTVAIDNMQVLESYDLIPEKVNDENDNEELAKEFGQIFTEHVTKTTSALSIGSIDASGFTTVKAYVTISTNYADSAEELKSLLSVYDCGVEITDFTIQKVNYSSCRTHLLCDVSGSMSGSVDELQNAVESYIKGKSKGESIAISMFDSYIVGTMPFGSSDDDLLAFVDQFGAYGGTSIYSSLLSVMRDFGTVENSKNVVILMTDGQDGWKQSAETIFTNIGGLAQEKNITVYTVGLGSVDASYLSTIAQSASGQFVPVNNSSSLTSFYEFLHTQVDNQYLITYTAKETSITDGRTLEVRVDSENLHSQKTYSLDYNDSEYGDDSDNQDDKNDVTELIIQGLQYSTVYKTGVESQNKLLGSGFTNSTVASIRFKGNVEYNLEMTYESETAFNFVIPEDIELDTYDVIIKIGNDTFEIKDGLIVCETGKPTTITFGGYVFTAASVTEVSSNCIRLSGNVTMNEWLHFFGDILITGNLETDTSIAVSDYSGSYVCFDTETSIGFGKFLGEKNVPVVIPPLETFWLNYDLAHLYDFENYSVNRIYTSAMTIYKLMEMDSIAVELYPDRMEITYQETKLDFPSLDKVFKSLTDDKLFASNKEGKAILSNKNVGIQFKYEPLEDDPDYVYIKMLNAKVGFDKNAVLVSLNTYTNEYEFGGGVKFSFFDFAIKASVGIKEAAFDKFSITIDKEKTTVMGGVPITFSDFTVGAEGIADLIKNNSFNELKIKGSMDVSAAKISAIAPKLKDFMGDVCLVQLDDAGIELELQPINIKASTEVKLFGEISLAEAEVQVGMFEYSNPLLGLKQETVGGIRAGITKGFKWDIDNVKIDIGATGELDILNRFCGVQLNNAHAEVVVTWWFLDVKMEEDAEALIGLYFTETGDPEFRIVLTYEGWFNRKQLVCIIDKNGKTSKDTITL